jgi:NTE family protein
VDHANGSPSPGPVAYVLGGGGHLGAFEVGMLRALRDAGVRPDLVVGTSIGAINGALVAADPEGHAVLALTKLWLGVSEAEVFGDSVLGRIGRLARTRTHVHSNEPLRRMLAEALPVRRIEQLAVPFQCVAASIERASEHWFTDGPIVDAVLASAAVPGLLPPVEIDGEHFLDGGLVHSIPVGRAVELGARTVYVLHVGRVERPLTPPRAPWEVASVAFEIARRHRFHKEMQELPAGVAAHVLPTGTAETGRQSQLSQLRYRDFSRVKARIEQAYQLSRAYLADQASPALAERGSGPEPDQERERPAEPGRTGTEPP